MADPYAAQSMQDAYSKQREGIKQRFNAQGQERNDALTRRFAAMGGGLSGGAAIKQQQLQDDSNSQQREEAIQGVNAHEAQSNFQSQEANQARAFQAGEAEKSRGLQKEQFGAEMGLRNKSFEFEKSAKLRDLDRLDQQFGLEAQAQGFNTELAKDQAKKTGGLFGGGGTLGLGLGF